MNDDFGLQTVEMWWLWTLTVNNGFECQIVNDGSERQTKDMMALMTALNAKLNNDSEFQTTNMTSNVKLKQTTTLNAKMEMQL